MVLITQHTPGGLVPFNGRGSGYECTALAENWACASCGLIQYTSRYSLDGYVYEYGRPPYGRCAATGYWAPVSMLVTVDGKRYIPEFAPAPRFSW